MPVQQTSEQISVVPTGLLALGRDSTPAAETGFQLCGIQQIEHAHEGVV